MAKIDEALASMPSEHRRARSNTTWSKGRSAPTVSSEKVPHGCFTAATSDEIVSRTNRPGDQSWQWPFVRLCLNALVLVPLPPILIFCVIPWLSPHCVEPTVWDQQWWYYLLLAPLSYALSATGVSITFVLMEVPVDRKFFIAMVIWVALQIVFRTPTEYLIASTIQSPPPQGPQAIQGVVVAACFGVFLIQYVLGGCKSVSKAVRKRALASAAWLALIQVTHYTFHAYCKLYEEIKADEDASPEELGQAEWKKTALAPAWLVVKMAVKHITGMLVRAGGNADASVLAMFIMDTWSAMITNFLFIGAQSGTVMVFICLDIIENLLYSGQCLFADQKFKQWRSAMKEEQEK